MDLIAAVQQIVFAQDERLLSMRNFIETEYPTVSRALKLLDCQQRKINKGFNLVKIESKKHGFLYYVRYPHNGQYLPSKWNTYTNNVIEAEIFAKENKDRIINLYLKNHDKKIFSIIGDFYDSKDFIIEQSRARDISDSVRKRYNRIIKKSFLPFIKESKVKKIEDINQKLLMDYQDWLLEKSIKPQTVNGNMNAIKRVMVYLKRKELIKEDVGKKVKNLTIRKKDRTPRGCYEIEKIRGVFNLKWDDNLSKLLCSIIYTTDLRNSEIKRIKKEDLINIGGINFINIKESKTENGIRIVPLHENVYSEIIAYSDKKEPNEFIFKKVFDRDFLKANCDLAKALNINKDIIDEENITFYSGRHFWKTLMSAEDLGEGIEEYFMGHKVTDDVARLYNHRDKAGKERMLQKAQKVISILDRCIFR